MAAEKKSSTKVRKKLWFTITAPQMFNNQILGEIPTFEIDSLINRELSINLMTLTANPKNQAVNVRFRVSEKVTDNRLTTKLVRYSLVPSNLRRFVRRDKEKIEQSFKVLDAKGHELVIKTFVVTRFAANRSRLTDLGKRIEEYCKVKIRKMHFETLITDLISSRFQKGIRDYVEKVYPLKVCEIREVILSVEGKSTPVSAEEIKAAEQQARQEADEKREKRKPRKRREQTQADEQATEEQKEEQ